MNLNETKARVARTLAKVERVEWYAKADAPYMVFSVGDRFPVPGLMRFVLRDLLGHAEYGPEEKMAWGFVLAFEGMTFGFELRKLSFAFVAPKDHGPTSKRGRALLGKLVKAIKLAEQHLDGVAIEQAGFGNVTIANRYSMFDEQYRFLRGLAETFYATEPPQPKVISIDESGQPTGWEHDWNRPQREGGFLAGAALNAFFSRVEHLFVLCLPFVGFDPTDGRLLDFIGAQWGGKFKVLFDLATDRDAKALFDALHRIRETYRNPLSHGGFEPGVGSLYFHLDRVGAIPARMTRHNRQPHFHFTPVGVANFTDACATFDRFDDFVKSGRLRYGVRWAETGLDVRFDKAGREDITDALASDEEFEAFVEREGHAYERHANMEY